MIIADNQITKQNLRNALTNLRSDSQSVVSIITNS